MYHFIKVSDYSLQFKCGHYLTSRQDLDKTDLCELTD